MTLYPPYEIIDTGSWTLGKYRGIGLDACNVQRLCALDAWVSAAYFLKASHPEDQMSRTTYFKIVTCDICGEYMYRTHVIPVYMAHVIPMNRAQKIPVKRVCHVCWLSCLCCIVTYILYIDVFILYIGVFGICSM